MMVEQGSQSARPAPVLMEAAPRSEASTHKSGLPLVSARPWFVQWKRLSALAGGHRPRRVTKSPVTPPATTAD